MGPKEGLNFPVRGPRYLDAHGISEFLTLSDRINITPRLGGCVADLIKYELIINVVNVGVRYNFFEGVQRLC